MSSVQHHYIQNNRKEFGVHMDKGLRKLYDAFKDYHDLVQQNGQAATIKDLAQNGQKPDYYFISCCDSRYDPSHLPHVGPGHHFKSEHIAALVPPHDQPEALSVGAAIEYAVTVLHVKYIIIMGHTQCGGVKELVESQDAEHNTELEHLSQWMNTAKGALSSMSQETLKKGGCSETCDLAEQHTILWSLKNLKNYPVVRRAMERGELSIHGWRYDIEHSIVECWDPTENAFVTY